MTKWSSGSNKGWRLVQYEDTILLSTSPNKIAHKDIAVAGLSVGVRSFIAGTFHYNAPYGSTSVGKVYCDGASNTHNSFWGPVADNNLVYPWIARCHGYAPFDGKMWWLAYYNKQLSDAEIADLKSGAKEPGDISGLYMHIKFDREVASTYETEIGLGPNAPYVFNVNGTPVAGVSSSDDTAILGHSFAVQSFSSGTLGHTFEVQPRMQRYRNLLYRDKITLRRKI
jgi:hypothetical protein